MSFLRSTLPTALLVGLPLLFASCGALPKNQLSEKQASEGWTLLFDGESLEHWRGFKQDAAPAGWIVDNGSIHLEESAGDLVTRETYDNFELLIDWKVGLGGNSGIFFRVSEDHDNVWETGPEFQILDDERHPNGSNPLTCAGSNYALHAPNRSVVNTTGAYNRTRIVVKGNDVEHWLNGHKIVSYSFRSPDWFQRVAESKFSTMPDYGLAREGHIALQDHGDAVWFKNIKIRRL